MLIKIIGLAFTVFLVTLYIVKLHNKSNSFQYILRGLVFPGEHIIDRISNYTRGVSRLSWSDVFMVYRRMGYNLGGGGGG